MANNFRFTNEKCIVCNRTFKHDDDIAVCPDCGTPHHRECYKENKKCANYEMHSETFKWEPTFIPFEPEKPKIEEQKKQSLYNLDLDINEIPFISKPSEMVNPYFRETYGEIEDGVQAEDVALFVRQEPQKYISKFQKVIKGKTTFNWAAFFFSPYWFFYRKLHKIGAIILTIFIILSSISLLPPVVQLNTEIYEFEAQLQEITETVETNEEYETAMLEIANEMKETMQKNKTGAVLIMAQSFASFVLSLFVGLNADKWYYKYTKEKIKSINTEAKPEDYKNALLMKGGTSYGAAFLAVLAEKAVFFALEMLITTFFK